MISITLGEFIALCIGVLIGRLTVYVAWDIYHDYLHRKELKKNIFNAETKERRSKV